VTRDEALWMLRNEMLEGELSSEEREALRVLSRPCIEIEGWEVVRDYVDKLPGATERFIELRRRA